tara:strand:- start:2737 stop:2952 length:216 start_codon:yes stop_codon:yes gene_type:complete
MDLIIAFALIVQLSPDSEEQVASHWINKKLCLVEARSLSSREENYRPVLAFCKPLFVDPKKNKIIGFAPQT